MQCFSLAKSKKNFYQWSEVASTYVDHMVRLNILGMAWKEHKSGESAKRVLGELKEIEDRLRNQICLDTFLKAYACHQSSSSSSPSSLPTTTPTPPLVRKPASTPSPSLPASSPASKTACSATQLAQSLPAHPIATTLATSQKAAPSQKKPTYCSQGVQKKSTHCSQGVQTEPRKDRKVQRPKIISQSSSTASASTSPSSSIPASSTTPTASPASSTSSSLPRPAPSPCPNCGSWSRFHPLSRCKRRRH